MSKSRGNVIYADDLVRYFGVDGVRHYCLIEMPYSSDGSITYESVAARYNSDLANNLGNLVKRTLDMTKKYFDGIVPDPGDTTENVIYDEDLRHTVAETVTSVDNYMNEYKIADAVESIFGMFRRANKYIDELPWGCKNETTNKASSRYIHLLET